MFIENLSVRKSALFALCCVIGISALRPAVSAQVTGSAAVTKPVEFGRPVSHRTPAKMGNGYLNILFGADAVRWRWVNYAGADVRRAFFVSVSSKAPTSDLSVLRPISAGASRPLLAPAQIRGIQPSSAWLTRQTPQPLAVAPLVTATNAIWKGGKGNWSSSNWSTGSGPNGAFNVLIDNGNVVASTVTLDESVGINNLTIDSDDSLSFNTNTSLTVNGGTISNAGKMTINGGNGTNTELILGANTTLSGGGSLTLSTVSANGGAAFIQGGVTLTNSETIQGDGVIGNGGLALTNQGTINANSTGANGTITSLSLNGTGAITNTGLMEATNNGVLVIGNPNSPNTVNNSGGNVTANGSQAVVLLNGTTIQGGTLNTVNGGTIESNGNGGNSVTLDGSTHGALTISKGSTYTSPFNSTTNILGTINNNGTIQLNGGNATNTFLNLVGNTTLQGGGTVNMMTIGANGGAAFIQGGGLMLTNTNDVIQGEGVIGNSTMALVNQASGIIDANSTGLNGVITSLTLNGTGAITNAGLMEATNVGVLVIGNPNSPNSVNNSGGNITANGQGAAVVFNGTTIQGGTLNTLNGGLMESNGNGGNSVTLDGSTKGALTISKGSTYTSPFNSTTNVLGTINNNGTIQLNGGGSTNTELNLVGNTTLQGGGTVNMTTIGANGGAAFIQGTNLTLTNVNDTIQGEGVIGNSNMALVNQAGGIIDANSTGQNGVVTSLSLNDTGAITNAGLLEATNQGVLVIGNPNSPNTVNNSGGNITANGPGALVLLNGTTIQGGTLNTLNGGTMESNGNGGNSVTLDGSTKGALTISKGSTYTSPFNSTTNVLGTINNNGTMQLNGGGSTNTELNLVGNTTLQGGGTVNMTTIGANGGAAFIQGTNLTLTNVNDTIQGEGVIGNSKMALVNQTGGIINANSTGQNGVVTSLSLNGTGAITNAGLMEATNQGVLVIGNPNSPNTVNNSGGNITANGPGTAVVFNGTTIQGGTLNTLNGGLMESNGNGGNSVTLDGSTKGALTISKGSTYTSPFNSTTNILGTINNNGTMQLNGGGSTNTELNLVGNTTLQGGGTLNMTTIPANGGSAFIQGNFTLTNVNNTIQGAGVIGNSGLALNNQTGGTIFASTPFQGISINGTGNITNSGTFRVAAGAGMHLSNGAFTNFSGTTLTGGTYNIAGTLEIDELGSGGGEIVTNAANISLNGVSSSFIDAAGRDALSNLATNATGSSFAITGGRNFTTAGNFTNNGTLTVGSGSDFTVHSSITNFSGSTLSGGTYNIGGILGFAGGGTGIATDAANITLSGTGEILNTSNGSNALLNLATIASGGSLTLSSAANFTTKGGLTDSGALTVNSGSTFTINGALNNLNTTTNTLTGGTYNVGGTLAFAGGTNGIEIDAGNLTLSGTGQLTNTATGVSALKNFNDIASGGSFTLTGGANFTTAGGFTDSGALTVNSGSTFDVNGVLKNLNTLNNTLTGGTYTVGGTLEFASATNSIVTDGANLTLSGSGRILNTSNGLANELANFSTIASGGSFALTNGANFTVSNRAFNNSGILTVNSGSTLNITGTGSSLSNFNSATNTLTGGTFVVGGTFEFTGANIATNAANLTLTGTAAKLLNSSNGLSGLAAFRTNASGGSFSLLGGASFTTAGAFTNSGSLTVGSGSIFSVTGNYTDAGSTRDDGSFSLLSGGALNVQSGGSLFGVGSVSGAINSNGIVTPGDSATSAGILKDTGAYTQASGGALDIFLSGTTAGTQYDQLNVTTASLAGVVNIKTPANFVPAVGIKFTIMNFIAGSGSLTPGTGFAINGSEHYALSCVATNCVITVVSGALSAAALKPVILPGSPANVSLARLWTARGSAMAGLSLRPLGLGGVWRQGFDFAGLRQIASVRGVARISMLPATRPANQISRRYWSSPVVPPSNVRNFSAVRPVGSVQVDSHTSGSFLRAQDSFRFFRNPGLGKFSANPGLQIRWMSGMQDFRTAAGSRSRASTLTGVSGAKIAGATFAASRTRPHASGLQGRSVMGGFSVPLNLSSKPKINFAIE